MKNYNNNPLIEIPKGGVLTTSNKKLLMNGKSPIDDPPHSATCKFAGMNDAMGICAEACACCWDKPIPDSYYDKAEYVGRRSKTGHTSILEHSNFVVLIKAGVGAFEEVSDIINSAFYLHHACVLAPGMRHYYILLGGSLRAFGDLFIKTRNKDSAVLNAIRECLYAYSNSNAFAHISDMGLMDPSKFSNPEIQSDDTIGSRNVESNELFDIINVDSVKMLHENLRSINEEAAECFSVYDLLDFCTVTVLFKNMSRIITQQLCRHRNGITQESQRYVNYSDACFNTPDLFKPGKYDPNYKYTINFGGKEFKLTLEELGSAMTNIYGMLTSDKNHPLMKEDARGYLPGNIQCRKIYITFTYRSLIKFLELREHKAAQAEIRMYAEKLGSWFRECTADVLDFENIYDYNLPRILVEEKYPDSMNGDKFTETTVEDTVTDMTEEDYIRILEMVENSTNNE